MTKVGRPHGEIALALLQAAADQPGTVRELACRAQVGFDAARFKAKDLVRAGHLQVIEPGRPMVVGVASRTDGQAKPADAGADLARAWLASPETLHYSPGNGRRQDHSRESARDAPAP